MRDVVRMTSERGRPARIRPATKKVRAGRPRSDMILFRRRCGQRRMRAVHGRIFPCSALFFDMGIEPCVKESHRTRRFPACARALEKNVALLFALLAGRACTAHETLRPALIPACESPAA